MTRSIATRSALLLSLLIAGASSAQDTLILRWGEQVPAGEVVGVGPQGVSLVTEEGTPVVIAWHRVRSLPARFEATAAEFAPIREDAWRAAVRLRRGDRIAAEPIFERLYSIYEDTSGPMAHFVARGLAICRIDAGFASAAVGPWLRTITAQQSPAGERLLGESTPLIAELAPFFAPGAPRVTAANGIAGVRAPGALSQLFAAAMLADSASLPFVGSGVTPTAADRERPRTPEDLLAVIALSRDESPDARQVARETLARWLDTSDRPLESWARVWCRLALGRSLVREQDPADRLAGVLELLRLPAAEPDTIPRLTALALYEASLTLQQLGEHAEATALGAELRTQFANDPAARAYEQSLNDPTLRIPNDSP